MSDQRITIGAMAQLAKPVGDHNTKDHQVLADRLEEMNSRLRLNYNGDIIVFIQSDGPSYDSGLVFADDSILEEFTEELILAGIFVFQGSAKVFFDNWYDGADPPHLQVTLEEADYEEDWRD